MRAYIEQLRGAPVEQIIAEVSSAMLNASQVKLGRPDGRLLIDVVAAIEETVRDRTEGDLADQLAQAVTQLRLAQVDAERELASDGQAGQDSTEQTASEGSSGHPSQAPGAGAGAGRLWTPGG